MKKLRKLLTLALALIMLVSVLALPAMAVTAEHECDHASEVQPRIPYVLCACGGQTKYVCIVDGFVKLQCESCGAYIYVPLG